MSCGRDSHDSAVARRARAMSDALENGDAEEALSGHHPRVVRGDFHPVTQAQAVQSLVAYLNDLRGVLTRVRDDERGLVVVCFGDAKVIVQLNCRKEEVFDEDTIIVKVAGRDIEHGKLSRSAGSLILNKLWLCTPVSERIVLAQENGV